MLKFLNAMCLLLDPWTHGEKNCGKDTAPAEPEKNQFRSVLIDHGCWEITHTKHRANTL